MTARCGYIAVTCCSLFLILLSADVRFSDDVIALEDPRNQSTGDSAEEQMAYCLGIVRKQAATPRDCQCDAATCCSSVLVYTHHITPAHRSNALPTFHSCCVRLHDPRQHTQQAQIQLDRVPRDKKTVDGSGFSKPGLDMIGNGNYNVGRCTVNSNAKRMGDKWSGDDNFDFKGSSNDIILCKCKSRTEYTHSGIPPGPEQYEIKKFAFAGSWAEEQAFCVGKGGRLPYVTSTRTHTHAYAHMQHLTDLAGTLNIHRHGVLMTDTFNIEYRWRDDECAGSIGSQAMCATRRTPSRSVATAMARVLAAPAPPLTNGRQLQTLTLERANTLDAAATSWAAIDVGASATLLTLEAFLAGGTKTVPRAGKAGPTADWTKNRQNHRERVFKREVASTYTNYRERMFWVGFIWPVEIAGDDNLLLSPRLLAGKRLNLRMFEQTLASQSCGFAIAASLCLTSYNAQQFEASR